VNTNEKLYLMQMSLVLVEPSLVTSQYAFKDEIYSGGQVEIKRELLKLYLMQMSLVLVEPSLITSQYAFKDEIYCGGAGRNKERITVLKHEIWMNLKRCH
jgi:flagellar assembly factor FliW